MAGYRIKKVLLSWQYLQNLLNTMWPIVQFYFSNMSNPVQFQLESGYQVLSPRCRWDLCQAKLHQRWRRDSNHRVVGAAKWRCHAQEFLLGLWRDFEMAVGSGRSTLGSEKPKELKRYPWICHQCVRQSLIANWFSLVVCSCCSPCNGNICTFRNVMWLVTGLKRYCYLGNICRTC